MLIEVFGTVSCEATRHTSEALRTLGVPFRFRDIAEDLDAQQYVHSDLGYRSTPVVIAGDLFHWAGHRPEILSILASS